eukprot:CAMPEP_0175125480 /NCGR_PEP_ID=MMETSP0087-20121206/3336_1 /TAXON_ID=136419 /ORGANISM="Unknown Unknown, Strain D1" /LENGTH=88 /DNA_ID=CAMNT_0016407315 /DNA_START=281 /DNA_END=547 /DNA_ORIENTATION=-
MAMVWEGRGIIKAVRKMVGPTEPLECNPGTIRGDFGAHWRRNIVHAADSPESVHKEVEMWFKPEELIEWDDSKAPWIYELPNAKQSFD